MLIPEPVWGAFLVHGVTLVEAGPDTLTLTTHEAPQDRTTFSVRSSSRTLGPRAVAEAISGWEHLAPHRTSAEAGSSTAAVRQPLLVAPSLSADAVQLLEAASWSWISLDSQGDISAHLRMRPCPVRFIPETPAPGAAARRGPAPWGRLTIVRHLLAGAPQTQADLSAAAGTGQPRASQVLTELADHGWVARRRGRPVTWQVSSWDQLLDWWLDTYPGPGGTSTHWTSLASVKEQALVASAALERARVVHPTHGTHQRGGPVLVSGDVAADDYAPWREPRRALLYAPTVVDLSTAGFTAVEAPDATLTVTSPRDPGLWPRGALVDLVTGWQPDPTVPLADPFQVLADLLHDSSVDADQAAGALRRALAQHVTSRTDRQQ